LPVDANNVHVYVEDTDKFCKRAIAARAKSLSESAGRPYGDRNAAVEDPFGNQWYAPTDIKM